MCARDSKYQYINPTTQVSLYSNCVGNCSNIQNISWNIYQEQTNQSSNVTQWILFNQMNSFDSIWFFGRNQTNFTSTNHLFLNNTKVNRWRFEVIYSFSFGISSSSLDFLINRPPSSNSSCSIDPRNGTITTLFTITCSNWFDENGIKDYSLYGLLE